MPGKAIPYNSKLNLCQLQYWIVIILYDRKLLMFQVFVTNFKQRYNQTLPQCTIYSLKNCFNYYLTIVATSRGTMCQNSTNQGT